MTNISDFASSAGDRRPLGMRTADQLQRVIRQQVLEHFLQRGIAWEAISHLRNHWDVVRTRQLPPRSGYGVIFYPPNAPLPHTDAYQEIDEEVRREAAHLRLRWLSALTSLSHAAIPTRFLDADLYSVLWQGFFSACVFYDPPEDALLAFADGWSPRPTARTPSEEHERGVPRLFFPAVKDARDWRKSEEARDAYWMRVIEKVAQRMGAEGIGLRERVEEVVRDDEELRRIESEALEGNPFKLHIEIDDYTTEAELRDALRVLREQRGVHIPGGADGRDPLIAVQCALLYDRHNGPDPEHADKRRRRWTYPRLAHEFGLSIQKKSRHYNGEESVIEVSQSAKDHVELGRQILEKSSTG